MSEPLPAEVTGIKLHRLVGEKLIACEEVHLVKGAPAVQLVLARAAICGRVEMEGKIKNHFADLIDKDGDIIATAALDSNSYRALKVRELRCKLQPEYRP